MSFKLFETTLIGDFLASADIKAFGHTYRYDCFVLISYFFTPRVFLFSISLLFVNKSLFCGNIKTNASLNLSFEKLKPLDFSYRMIHQYS